MNFEIKALDLDAASQEKCDALVVLVPSAAQWGPKGLAGLVQAAIQDGDFSAKPGKTLALYRPAHTVARRVVLAGVGEGDAKSVKSAVSAAVSLLKPAEPRKMVIASPGELTEAALRSAMLAVADTTYSYTATKSKGEARPLARVLMAASNARQLGACFQATQACIQGIEVAKEWANRPANHATPSMLAKAAQALAKHPSMHCEVLGPKEVHKLGMGAFTAVAAGSNEPLRFIVLRYEGAARHDAPVVLVGKGITFDSGGISIKPAPEMDEMKFDMSGAASVLGVFQALSVLRPEINVVGLIPACENLPSGTAVKPGDVVTSMSGQTIEILNTDAEGRLVLCDALTYAERFKPRAVVDIATLTGACVIALGAVRSGMFTSNAELAQALLQASERSQDLCWQMPLDDDYAEGLKTNFADVANVAGRAAGAVTAAKFLQRFADKFPWAHLDIAGTAWKGGGAKGATGRPVALLVEYLLSQVPPSGRRASAKAKR